MSYKDLLDKAILNKKNYMRLFPHGLVEDNHKVGFAGADGWHWYYEEKDIVPLCHSKKDRREVE